MSRPELSEYAHSARKIMVHCNFISETITYFKESFWELKLAEDRPVKAGVGWLTRMPDRKENVEIQC